MNYGCVRAGCPVHTATSALVGWFLLGFAALFTATAAAADTERWTGIRTALYGERPIHTGDPVITLEAPYRAHDAAVVPVEIRALIPQTEERYIKALRLIVDQNPTPVAATFHFSGAHGWANIGTRIRINEYTHVRAVAELGNGELYMSEKYVKASGGCSAPALKDQESAVARLGKMKLKLPESPQVGKPLSAQLLVSHPNNSGMQFDQVSRMYIPAHFVRRMTVDYAGEPILTVEADFSLSEDPSIEFTFVPDTDGALRFRVEDSNDMHFEREWRVTASTL